MQEPDSNDFYTAGFELSRQIREADKGILSAKRAQALLKDFLCQHEDILEALQSIVARPSFAPLLKSPHDAGVFARKQSIVASIRKTYSQEVVFATEDFINGLLSLDERATPHQAANQPTNHHRKTNTQQELSATNKPRERASKAESPHKGKHIKPALFLMALGFFSLALASIRYYTSNHQAIQEETKTKPSSHTPKDCPTDLSANPTTVASATDVTLISTGVQWAGVGYLGGLRELHNGAFTGEKTFKLKGGIEISTDNPKALLVRFGNCPAIPMQRASYQQLRGKWDYEKTSKGFEELLKEHPEILEGAKN